MMDRDKQIEEMAKIIFQEPHVGGLYGFDERIASRLYNAGYRKASDLAEEIFAEIGNRLDALLKMAPGGGDYTSAKTFLDAHWEFIENSIKSKYTEEGK